MLYAEKDDPREAPESVLIGAKIPLQAKSGLSHKVKLDGMTMSGKV